MGFFRRKVARQRETVAPLQSVSLEVIDHHQDVVEDVEKLTFNNTPLISNDNLKNDREKDLHIIVFANEKGGVGKSTTAFHTCVALTNAGESVVAIDLDHRQQSLAKILRKRQEMSRHLEIDFSTPDTPHMHDQNAASLDELIRKHRRSHNFMIIDVAGHDSAVARHAIKLANTLVTPINDSFVDIEVLGHIDPTSLQFNVLAPFSRLVQNAMQSRIASVQGSMEWVVVQNRLRSVKTMNGQKFAGALDEISKAAGFRLVPGLHERVIYRELIPFGLTLLDLPSIPKMARAHPVAQSELQSLLSALELPTEVAF